VSRSRISLLLLAVLAIAGGCASKERVASTVVFLPPKGEKKEGEPEDPKEHKHVWEEWTWHTYEDWSEGTPVTKIATVYRCTGCGAIRDESQRQRK
jgi:hypothetical protein